MKYILALIAVVLSIYFIVQVRRRSTRVVCLIYFELIYNLVIKFLIGNIGLPSVLNYVSDVILVWILLEYLMQKKVKRLRVPKSLKIGCTVLLLVSIVSYALNVYSPLLYIWGFRNNFRFLLFAMMCAVYLDGNDIKTLFDILYGFFLVNILVVTYQFFFVTYADYAKGDFISGLFSNGAERGGNASLDWLMCIMCTYVTVQYLNKEIKLKKLLICLIGSIYMAALAEIKLVFVQIALIGLLAVVICRKSLKIIGFVALGSVALVFGIRMLYSMFPDFADFFTPENMLAYVTREGGYSSRGFDVGLDRLTALPFVFEHFLPTFFKKLFGIGLGNADFSSFSFMTSDFYIKNSWSGYASFYSAIITVELGLAGLVCYLEIILNYLREAISVKAKAPGDNTIKQFVMIISLLCLLVVFSNQTMKLEASAYLVHCVMVLPFILKKNCGSIEEANSKIKKIRLKIR